jgi:hypothetical protein
VQTNLTPDDTAASRAMARVKALSSTVFSTHPGNP